MKQAAARAKAKKAGGAPATAATPANKIAASPRVPGTRDPRLALPKNLTKKGWDYSMYMNRDDAESDRRWFAKQWTAAAKNEIKLRNEIASLKKMRGGGTKELDNKINAIKAKIKDVDNSIFAKEARKRLGTLVAASNQSGKRLKELDRRVQEADRRVKEAGQRLQAANDKLAATRAKNAQRKADFQKRFGMSYEESIARLGKAKKARR
jgi:hypothetical protein